MAGKRLSKLEHRRITKAVDDAERITGLQFCVYAGPGEEDSRAHAERLFVEGGLHTRPAVLVLVAPDVRRVEIVTAPDVRGRIPDAAASRAIDAMVPLFTIGDIAGGLEAGIAVLAGAAGSGTASGEELPDVLDS